MLAILTAVKWVQANWKLVAIAAIMATSFGLGWHIKGYIAEAAQNQAIADAVAKTKAEERSLYEKATQLEKRKRAIREKARLANTDIYSAGGDTCSDKPVSTDIMHLIERAYDNITG